MSSQCARRSPSCRPFAASVFWASLLFCPRISGTGTPGTAVSVAVGVVVGGIDVAVGGAAVAVGGTDVAVGGAAVAVGGTDVAVGGAAVAVGGALMVVSDGTAVASTSRTGACGADPMPLLLVCTTAGCAPATAAGILAMCAGRV